MHSSMDNKGFSNFKKGKYFYRLPWIEVKFGSISLEVAYVDWISKLGVSSYFK